MMTIRVSCPECGTVELTPGDIQLTVVRTAAQSVAPDSRYAFECPTCTQVVEKPADERVAELLATGGVPTEVVSTPVVSTPVHPERHPGGPPLDMDDLLDLALLLRGGDWFDELLGLDG